MTLPGMLVPAGRDRSPRTVDGFDRTSGSSPRQVDFAPMDIKAEVAGAVFEILAREGETVAKGAPLLILESMKMEIVVQAPASGAVARVLVDINDIVEAGQVLVRLDP